jgi:hypothetical protein
MGRSSNLKGFWQCLINPDYAKTAFRVALIVGSILFAINPGIALWRGQIALGALVGLTLWSYWRYRRCCRKPNL